MHLSMHSFNKNSKGLFRGLGPGLDARDGLEPGRAERPLLSQGLCSGVGCGHTMTGIYGDELGGRFHLGMVGGGSWRRTKTSEMSLRFQSE